MGFVPARWSLARLRRADSLDEQLRSITELVARTVAVVDDLALAAGPGSVDRFLSLRNGLAVIDVTIDSAYTAVACRDSNAAEEALSAAVARASALTGLLGPQAC